MSTSTDIEGDDALQLLVRGVSQGDDDTVPYRTGELVSFGLTEHGYGLGPMIAETHAVTVNGRAGSGGSITPVPHNRPRD